MKSKQIRTFCSSLALILSISSAEAQYQIRASVLAGGGLSASNANHRLSSTAGQTFIGAPQAATFRKQVGFWRPAQQLTPVEALPNIIPTEYRLDQNYPNPFNPSTRITFAVQERANVQLVVYNILGQVVSTLVDAEMTPGIYEASFDAHSYASGVYFYRIIANTFV